MMPERSTAHWLDRPTRMLAQHRRAVSVIGAIWFWTGIAIYARFIQLPEIPEIVRQGFFWSGVAANAVWWGYLNGAIEQRRKALEAQDRTIIED